MLFICPKCQSPLTQIGGVNQVACDRCRCIFIIRIELKELDQFYNYDTMVGQSSGTEVDSGFSES
jgi:Zn-finger nucleic acid-binding protein